MCLTRMQKQLGLRLSEISVVPADIGITMETNLSKLSHTGANSADDSSIVRNKSFYASVAKTLASCSSLETNRLPKQGRYQCKFCQKSFTRPSHLTRHIRIHTGEKPFKCLLCGKGFRQSNHLTSHMKTHNAIKHSTGAPTSLVSVDAIQDVGIKKRPDPASGTLTTSGQTFADVSKNPLASQPFSKCSSTPTSSLTSSLNPASSITSSLTPTSSISSSLTPTSSITSSSLTPTSSLTSSLTSTAVRSPLQRQLAMPPLSVNPPRNTNNTDNVMLRTSSENAFSSAVTTKRPSGTLLPNSQLLSQVGATQPHNWQKQHSNQLAPGGQECTKKTSNNNLSTKQTLRCELCNKQFVNSTFLDIHMQMHSAIQFKTKLRLKADSTDGNISNALSVSSANSRAVAATAAAPAKLNMKENMCLHANTIRGLLNKPYPVLSNLQTCLDKDILSPLKEVTIKPDPDAVVIEGVSHHQTKLTPDLETALKKDSLLQSNRSDSMTHISKQAQNMNNKLNYSQNVQQTSEPSTSGKKAPHLLNSGEKFPSSELQKESRSDPVSVLYPNSGTESAKTSETNVQQPSLHNLTIKEQLSRCTFCNKDFANSVILAQHVRSHIKDISAGSSYQFPAQAAAATATDLIVNTSKETSVSRSSSLVPRDKGRHLQLAASPALFPPRESPFTKKSGTDSFVGRRKIRSEANFIRKSSVNYRHGTSYFTSAGQIRNICKSFSLQGRHFKQLNSFSGSMLGSQQWNQNQGLSSKGQKRFKCRHCIKAFSRPSHLLRHVRIHTGEKPFKCKYCDKRFRQSNHLTSHIKTHSAGRPVNCPHCNKTLLSLTQLSHHIKISHMGRPVVMPDNRHDKRVTASLNINSSKCHQQDNNIQTTDEKLQNPSVPASNLSSSCAQGETSFSRRPPSPQSQILFDDWPKASAPPASTTLQALAAQPCLENRLAEVQADDSKELSPILIDRTIKEEPLSDLETSEQCLLSAPEPTATDPPLNNTNNNSSRILQENIQFSPKSQDASLSVGQFHNTQPLTSSSEDMLDSNTQGHVSTVKDHTNSSQLIDNPSLADLELASNGNQKEDTTVVFTSQTSESTDSTAVYLIKKSLSQDKYSTYLVSLNESDVPFTKQEPPEEEVEQMPETSYLTNPNTNKAEYSTSDNLVSSTSSEILAGTQRNSAMNECLKDTVLPVIPGRASGLCADFQPQKDPVGMPTTKEEKRPFIRDLQDDPLLASNDPQLSECNKYNGKFSESFTLSRHLGFSNKQDAEKNFNAKRSSYISRVIPPHRLFQCSVCDQQFPDPLNLEIHIKSHSVSAAASTIRSSTNVVERSTDALTSNAAQNARGKNYLTPHKNSPKPNLAPQKPEIRKGIKLYRFLHRPHASKKSLGASTLNRSTVSTVTALSKTNVPAVPAKQNWISHKTITNGRRCFKCSFCEKSFSRPSHLIRHVRIHTGEKPFKCTLCSKSFTQSNHLTSHLKTHMEKVGSLVCQHCQKVFLLPNVFVAHLQTHAAVPAPSNHPVQKRIASEKENLANPCPSSSLSAKLPANSTNDGLSSDTPTTSTTNTTALPSAASQSSTIRKLLSLRTPMLQPADGRHLRDFDATDHIITLGPHSLTSVPYRFGSDVSKTSQPDSIDLASKNSDSSCIYEKNSIKLEQDDSRGLSEISVINNQNALSTVENNWNKNAPFHSDGNIRNDDSNSINYHKSPEIGAIGAGQEPAYNMDVKPNIPISISLTPPGEVRTGCGTGAVGPESGPSSVGTSTESTPNSTKQTCLTVSPPKIFSFECCNSVFGSIGEFQQHVTAHANDPVEPDACDGVKIKTEVL